MTNSFLHAPSIFITTHTHPLQKPYSRGCLKSNNICCTLSNRMGSEGTHQLRQAQNNHDINQIATLPLRNGLSILMNHGLLKAHFFTNEKCVQTIPISERRKTPFISYGCRHVFILFSYTIVPRCKQHYLKFSIRQQIKSLN